MMALLNTKLVLLFFLQSPQNSPLCTTSMHDSNYFKWRPTLPTYIVPKKPVQQQFQTQHLPFFCHQEWKLEKQWNIRLRLRMGSLEHVNYLEGKNTTTP
jgi:hypothetical protein